MSYEEEADRGVRPEPSKKVLEGEGILATGDVGPVIDEDRVCTNPHHAIEPDLHPLMAGGAGEAGSHGQLRIEIATKGGFRDLGLWQTGVAGAQKPTEREDGGGPTALRHNSDSGGGGGGDCTAA
jgi:hypothetical protein